MEPAGRSALLFITTAQVCSPLSRVVTKSCQVHVRIASSHQLGAAQISSKISLLNTFSFLKYSYSRRDDDRVCGCTYMPH